MGGIDDEVAVDGELSARYICSKGSTIDRHGLRIGEYECVCGCLLNVSYSVVQLFHPGGRSEGNGDELSCAECLSIAHAMGGLGYHDREGIRDIIGSKLTERKMAKGRIWGNGIFVGRLFVDEVVEG